MADRSVVVRLRAEVQGFVAGVSTAKKSLGEFSGELDKLGQQHKEKFDKVIRPAAMVGAGLVAAFGLAVKAAADFDKQMSEVAAVSGATGKDLGLLRQAALDAGRDTAYSATEAAKAEAELTKAGMSTKDVLGGGLKGALSLAAAGQIDLADAATITAQSLNTFHLNGAAASHTADILAAAANKSASDVEQLSRGMGQAGLVASQAGWSFKDTTAVLAAFADRGLQGSDAGTSLKTMLLALENPSKKAAETMQQLGINAYDANGHFVTASGLAGQLKEKLGGLSEQERNTALATIFGSDAIRAANVLYDQGSDGISKYSGAVDDYGAAARVAQQKTDNLAGDLERLKGSLETVAIQAGSGANTGLRTLVQTADGALHIFGSLPAPLQATLTILAGLSGATLLASAGFLKARQTAQEMLTALREMGPTGEKAAAGVTKIGKAAAALGTIGTVATVAWMAIDYFANRTLNAKMNVDEMTNSLNRFSQNGQVGGEMARAFGKDLSGLASDLSKVNAAYEKVNAESRQGTKQKVAGAFAGGAFSAGYAGPAGQAAIKAAPSAADLKSLDQGLANLVSSGNATAAKAAYDQLAAATERYGGSVADLNAKLPEYQKATAGAAAASTGMANGFGTATSNARTLVQSWQDAIEKGQSLYDLFVQLNGGALNFAEAEIRVEQAVDDLAASFAKNGTSLDVNTEKGRANKEAILQTADAAAKAADAKFRETGSLEQASATYNGYIAQLRATLKQAGLTDAQINTVIQTYARMPPAITTQLKVLGVDAATEQIKSITARVNALDNRTVNTYVVVNTQTNETRTITRSSQQFQRRGGVVHAAGGLAPGIYPDGAEITHFAERGTGGELYLPLRGITQQRAAALVNVAANRYGLAVTPAGAGRGSTTVINVSFSAGLGADMRRAGQEIIDLIRPVVRSGGGNVQVVLGKPGA